MPTLLTDRLLALLFPETCPCCAAPGLSHRVAPFCTGCWSGLQIYSGPVCRHCGLPLPSAHARRCGECSLNPPEFRSHRSFGLYEGTLKEAIHQLKYRKVRRLAQPLADLLCRMDIPPVDCIVPVPVHPGRLREREFNQVGLLARHVSLRTRIPVDIHSLVKTRDTVPQVGRPRRERLTGVRNTFTVRHNGRIKGRRVLVLDDVATTGATVRACAEALDRAGAEEIHVLTLARSSPDVWGNTEA